MKKIILFALLLVAGYYGSKFVVGYSLAKQVHRCALEVNSASRLQGAKTEVEKRQINLSVYDCVEKNLAFPGSLGYNAQKFRASVD